MRFWKQLKNIKLSDPDEPTAVLSPQERIENKRPAGEVSKQMMNLNERSLAGFYVAMHREEAAGGRWHRYKVLNG